MAKRRQFTGKKGTGDFLSDEEFEYYCKEVYRLQKRREAYRRRQEPLKRAKKLTNQPQ